MWHYVALCGSIQKGLKLQCFPASLFFANVGKRLWHYVALCGTMRRYPKEVKEWQCSCVPFFLLQIAGKKLWHYEALCGSMWQGEKLQCSCFPFFFKLWEKDCGTMWQYMWQYVALCGEKLQSSCVRVLWGKGCGTAGSCLLSVPSCGRMLKTLSCLWTLLHVTASV